MVDYPVPLLGFAAWSGTGKTTLLARLLPVLKSRGLQVAVIKHAHHSFDPDQPGKDSHTLRKAGADRVLVSSRRRMALIAERPPGLGEPDLAEALTLLDPAGLDLVLVEGFKHEHFPKIELYRAAVGKPPLHPEDGDIIALATDEAAPPPDCRLPWLPLDRPEHIADFVMRFAGIAGHTAARPA